MLRNKKKVVISSENDDWVSSVSLCSPLDAQITLVDNLTDTSLFN